MASINAQVQLINHTLNKLPKEIKRAKAKIETKAVRLMVNGIREGTPLGPSRRKIKVKDISWRNRTAGNLKKSIGRIKIKKAKYTYVGVRAGKDYRYDGYYAPFLEYGTVNMAPDPFFDKAAKKAVPAARTALVDGAKLVLQEFKVKNSR